MSDIVPLENGEIQARGLMLHFNLHSIFFDVIQIEKAMFRLLSQDIYIRVLSHHHLIEDFALVRDSI